VRVGEEAPQATLSYQMQAWAGSLGHHVALWRRAAELRPDVSLPPGGRSDASQWRSATRYLLPDETPLHSPSLRSLVRMPHNSARKYKANDAQ
jgi:hypothetical protein